MSRSTRRVKRGSTGKNAPRLGRRVRSDTELGEEIARLCSRGTGIADARSGRRGRAVRLTRDDRVYMVTLQGAEHATVGTAAGAWERPAGSPTIRLLDDAERERLEASTTPA